MTPRPAPMGNFTGVTPRIVRRLHLYQVPPRVRVAMDTWQFWFTILVLAVAGLGVAAFKNYSDVARTQNEQAIIQAKQSLDEQLKTTQIHAQANATYTQCVRSIPSLQRLEGFIRGEKAESAILVTNSAAVLASTLPESSQFHVRLANLKRLRKANAKVQRVIDLPIPTVKVCAQRRNAILKSAAIKPPPNNRP